jgi:DNA mismatch repair protein MutS2
VTPTPPRTPSAIDEQTLLDLGWPELTGHLAERSKTPLGRAAALELVPLADLAAARARLALVDEVRALLAAGAPLPLAGIGDIREALARARVGGALDADGLIAVADAAHGYGRVRAHLLARRERSPGLAALGGEIDDLAHVALPIHESFDAERRLVDHASDALGPLRRAVARIRAELTAKAEELMGELVQHLQDTFYTQRNERYVLPVRVDARNWVKGIVHGTSGSGQTIFVEPTAMIELNNQLALGEAEVTEEERRIMARLTGYVAEEADALAAAGRVATELDVVQAAGELADRLRGFAPELALGVGFDLRRARHPLMELGGRPCVPNDIALAAGGGLVVSGPNAGGKTVALKTLGLAALMARAGLHIACGEGSVVPWFDRVLSDIGDAQSIEKNLSTFSAHLISVGRFVAAADRATLVLVDELAVGTEPEQGAALAQAALEALVERGASVVVTTHYERLKAMAAADPRFTNASVGFDLDTMSPTFRLHLGVPGSSGALFLARRLGLDGGLIERAEALVGDRHQGVELLLGELDGARRKLDDERALLERSRGEAELAKARAEDAHRRAEEREKASHLKTHNQAIVALTQARLELERIRGELKKQKSEDELAAREREVDDTARRVGKHAPAPEGAAGAPPAAEALEPGTPILVVGVGRGEVVAPPDRGGKVLVSIGGGMRTTVPLERVRLDPQGKRDKKRRQKGGVQISTAASAQAESGEASRAFVRTSDSTVDVRGERVDDALAQLDRFVDGSLGRGAPIVFVVHGHGSGALRSAVRSHLTGHRGVRSFRAGEPSEGGDGVTIAILDL